MFTTQWWIEQCYKYPLCIATRSAFADWLIDNNREREGKLLAVLSQLLRYDWPAAQKEWRKLPMHSIRHVWNHGLIPNKKSDYLAFCLLNRFTYRCKLPLLQLTTSYQNLIIDTELAACELIPWKKSHPDSCGLTEAVDVYNAASLVGYYSPYGTRHKRRNRLAIFYRDWLGYNKIVRQLNHQFGLGD
jgi:hypothetical protein